LALKRPGWRNWQTRRFQKPVPARAWGFDSPPRHHGLKDLRRFGTITAFGHRSLVRPVYDLLPNFTQHADNNSFSRLKSCPIRSLGKDREASLVHRSRRPVFDLWAECFAHRGVKGRDCGRRGGGTSIHRMIRKPVTLPPARPTDRRPALQRGRAGDQGGPSKCAEVTARRLIFALPPRHPFGMYN
jgi:hypothetical protein